jgi:tetratricopeptide (TPR) repeat protein
MPAKKKSSSSQSASRPRRLEEGLDFASKLLEEGNAQQAYALLLELDSAYPNNGEVLGFLADACLALKDWQGHEWALHRLVYLEPDNPIAHFVAGVAYLTNQRPALASRMLIRFVKRWPTHPKAGDARDVLAQAAQIHAIERAQYKYPLTEDAELLHEELRLLLDHEDFTRAEQTARRLLKKAPDFIPGLNNLCQIHALQGSWAQAQSLALRVLSLEPENIHALSNLIRIYFLSGRELDARHLLPRLLESQAPAAAFYAKKAESLAWLDESQALIELNQVMQADQSPRAVEARQSPHYLHMIAAAYARQGNAKEAQDFWRKALEISPNFTPARVNLDDLQRPPAERSGAWYFSIREWVPQKTVQALFRLAEKTASPAKIQDFLDAHPELHHLSPFMLQRGDETTRQFVFALCALSRSPVLMEHLKTFIQHPQGSDQERMRAAQILVDAGVLPAGKLTLWAKGKQREVALLGYEISYEPLGQYTNPSAQRLGERAYRALEEGRPQQARKLLEEALVLDPEQPSLLNNLALAFSRLGDEAQAEAIHQEIRRRFPDYFFGIAAEARQSLQDGNLEHAKALLEQLAQQRTLHIAELTTLCGLQIDLHLLTGDLESADMWLNLWERTDPEHPDLSRYRARIHPAPSKAAEKLIKRLSGPRRS